VNGNDTLANASPPYSSVPFLTITAALAKASAGQTVWVLPGTYNESVTIPTGVCIQGMNVQTTIIQQVGVTSPTTLVTMGINTRLQDVTLELTTSSNVALTGIHFPTGTPQAAKVRSVVLNVTSTGSTGAITGVLSDGTSSTATSSSQATAATTINVTSSSVGPNRGLLVSAANRFTIRDTNIFVNGSAADNVGVETTDVGSIANLITSTIYGATTGIGTTHQDIKRTAGSLILSATDLRTNNAGTNSFTVANSVPTKQFGILGNLAANRRYYLVMGTVTVASLFNEASSNPYTPVNVSPIPFVQDSIVIVLTLSFTGTLGTGISITFNIHKNNGVVPVLSLTLNNGEGQIKNLTTSSAVFTTNDTIDATVVTNGDPGTGSFIGLVGFY
jgi:hypothetical protein